MRITTIVSLAAAAALGLSACGSQATTPEAAPAAAGATPSADTSASESVSASPDASASAAPSATPAPDAVPAAGAYLTNAEYQSTIAEREGTTLVYFFHADWCPTCRATEASISADGLPDGLTVVKVDYDSEIDLRKQYGITQQHTFVQVDADGGELAKWTGSISGADIEAQTV